MRIAGQELGSPNIEVIVLPRTNKKGERYDLVLHAQAVLDIKEFDRLVPEPNIPDKLVKNKRVPDPDRPDYQNKLTIRNEQRMGWLVVKSLAATEGIEWSKVDFTKPETFVFWREELEEAGFNQGELNQIVTGVMAANSLDDLRIQEAKKRFLASLSAGDKAQLSPEEEQQNIQSGGLVNV